MARLRVHNFSISIDGYGAGANQRLESPLGDGGVELHRWVFDTRAGREMLGKPGGSTGLNDELFRRRTEGIGATIMGRNMFGPVRGPWPDESWRGWWGDRPPFGHDVFVLTHHHRPDLVMQNGTSFHFVESTPREVLDMAAVAAGGRDVVLGGGVGTIRQFLAEGLIDELHLVIAPVLLGAGERLLGDLPIDPSMYTCSALQCAGGVAHVTMTRSDETPGHADVVRSGATP